MNALTSILVVCALLGFSASFVMRFWKLISAVMDRFLGLPPFEKVVVVVLLAVATVSAQKGGTNAPPMLGMSGPRRVQSPPVGSGVTARPDVTPEDVARGWQIVVNTNACYSYAMPDGAVLQSNWWLRGAYEDVARLELGEPYGSFWAFTWGKMRRHLRYASNELAAVGAPMSSVPNASRLWWGVGADDSRLVTWENFFLNRDTNTPVNAQIELRRNGDYVLRSNEIERVFRQINPDDWDDDGVPNDIDEHPYQAVDLVGQSDEERARINSAVGFGQENGYYRFAVSFPDELDRVMRLTVGTNSIVVNAAGEYYFLLEKGVGYSIEVTPFCADVTCSAVDDIVPDTMLMLQSLWGGLLEWTVDGDSWELRYPGVGTLGYCAWWPKFQGSPSVGHLGPGGGPYVFTAEFTDYRHAEDVAYHWTSGDPNVIIVSPNAQETEVRFAEMPSWQSTTLSVTAQTAQRTYRSNLLGVTYGTNDTPQVSVSLQAPEVVFLNDDDRTSRWYRVSVGVSCPVETNVVVSFDHSGSTGISFATDSKGEDPTSLSSVSASVSQNWQEPHCFYFKCASLGSGTFTVTCTTQDGETITESEAYKVIEPLCKLVCTEAAPNGGFYNPSRLVYGTNAWLRVGVNGAFDASDVEWKVVSGPGRIMSTNGWAVSIEPTAPSGEVVVEAAFGHDDEIQPQFVMPVVQNRRVSICVSTIVDFMGNPVWTQQEVDAAIRVANEMYSQSGIEFYRQGPVLHIADDAFLTIAEHNARTNSSGKVIYIGTNPQVTNLIAQVKSASTIRLFMVDKIIHGTPLAFTRRSERCCFFAHNQEATPSVMAHELGHAMGLRDIYNRLKHNPQVCIPGGDFPVYQGLCADVSRDWGRSDGRGFYEKTDTQNQTIMQFLMHGRDAGGTDIPYSSFEGFSMTSKHKVEVEKVPIGSSNIRGD